MLAYLVAHCCLLRQAGGQSIGGIEQRPAG
jgi:hypothetical protein